MIYITPKHCLLSSFLKNINSPNKNRKKPEWKKLKQKNPKCGLTYDGLL